jgi:hypothetical protein
MQAEDTEFAFEIRDNDYTVVSTAFRHMKEAIDAWEEKNYYPVDIACEMRFTAGSEATLVNISRKSSHLFYCFFPIFFVWEGMHDVWEDIKTVLSLAK